MGDDNFSRRLSMLAGRRKNSKPADTSPPVPDARIANVMGAATAVPVAEQASSPHMAPLAMPQELAGEGEGAAPRAIEPGPAPAPQPSQQPSLQPPPQSPPQSPPQTVAAPPIVPDLVSAGASNDPTHEYDVDFREEPHPATFDVPTPPQHREANADPRVEPESCAPHPSEDAPADPVSGEAAPQARETAPDRSVAVDPFESSELEALKARMAARSAARAQEAGQEAGANAAAATPPAPAPPAAAPTSAPIEPTHAAPVEQAAPAERLAHPEPVAYAEPAARGEPVVHTPAPEAEAPVEVPAAPHALPLPAVDPRPVAQEAQGSKSAPTVPFDPQSVPSTAQPDCRAAAQPAPLRDLPPGMLMSFRPRERVDEERVFDPNAPRNRSTGHVISCSGDGAIIRANTGCYDTVTGDQWAVGRMLSIQAGGNRIVALVHHLETPLADYDPDAESSTLLIHVELQGEVQDREDGTSKFQKGITSYPPVGAICHQIRAADLGAIYAATGGSTAEIGTLSQDASVPAFVEIEDMIAKHFAVLGSTGCGKSSSVSLLLHASQEIMPDLRVLILDPHNEYSCAFPDSTTVTGDTLDLPFWLFQLEEYVECLFRGKPVVQEEVDALREFVPQAKIRFRDGDERKSLRQQDNANNAITADTPIPYRVSDLLGVLDEELGLLDSKMDKSILKSLKNRIDTHSNDPRFAFMFRHRTITDVAGDVLGRLFAMAPDTKGLTTVLQMAGMPAEVVNAVASVLCRMAFELSIAARGGMKILVVCEEAHRYVPVDAAAAFGPTRRAIARIAKEGRKYGCFMAIVSQRPAELDPTILSQCCTVFSLRLGNDADQDIIRKSISTGSASAVTFLSSIGNREAIAFGEGFSTPMRMRFANLPVQWLPGQDSDVFGHMGGERTALELAPVLAAWRGGGH